MPEIKKIAGGRIYLRELTLDDVSEEYCQWLNDPTVNKYLETRKCTMGELREFVQKQIDDPNSVFLGVFDRENDKHIGNVKLEPIDWQKKKAIFGILIGRKEYWGKGIGTEATKLTLDFAFGQLGLSEIELGVIGENKPARGVFEASGFKVKEIKEKFVNHEGVLYDKVVMTIKKYV